MRFTEDDMDTYKIELTEKQLQVLSAALNEIPYRLAAPVMADLQRQITAQEQESLGADAGHGPLDAKLPEPRRLDEKRDDPPPPSPEEFREAMRRKVAKEEAEFKAALKARGEGK